MPNWCENRLMIYCDGEDGIKQLAEFVEKAVYEWSEETWGGETQTDLSLAKFCPEPEYVNSDDWYNWRIEHWGTKWDVQAYLIDCNKDYASYEFDSAWTPPVPWLKVVAKDYPLLKFILKYDEPGGQFMGVAEAQGDVFDDKYLEYGRNLE